MSRKPAEADPGRIRPLATLPVFLQLAGQCAVVAGNGDAAAWKAELLAAAGADVVVHAPTPGPALTGLVARGSSAGTLTHVAACWTRADLAGAAIAVIDAVDDPEAEAFHAAARDAGALVNAIDRPAFCQFSFGAIVNRSPVVVGISTGGAAPILTQAIRRRIETLLPPALAAWGAFARSARAAVKRRLPSASQRRAFWNRLSDRAFGPPPEDWDRELGRLFGGCGADATVGGRVTLVGAGPGDAEYLTVKAVRALQSADVILFDDLVSGDVLELARREAKRLMVGKRGGRPSCGQDEINATMLKLARQGKHVVRLKSGDPMVFGRAGEEIAMLSAHGIRIDVVPGITAAAALASRLGVSLTHRDQAHSVRFVTGHARNGRLPDDLDWRGLADPETTLIFYMAGRTAPEVAARLCGNGLPRHTPAVVAAGLSRQAETVWSGTLEDLGRHRAVIDTTEPVLIGIGGVFAAVQTSAQAIDDLSERVGLGA